MSRHKGKLNFFRYYKVIIIKLIDDNCKENGRIKFSIIIIRNPKETKIVNRVHLFFRIHWNVR